jgi:hypothetical protein
MYKSGLKDSEYLVNLIRSKDEFKKLKVSDQIDSIKESMPVAISNHISFGYMKGSILYFVFSHPVGLSEFNNKKNFILKNIEILREYGKVRLNIEDIKAYVKDFVPNQPKGCYFKPAIIKYSEISNADFDNIFEDASLRKIVEKLKTNIKKIKEK